MMSHQNVYLFFFSLISTIWGHAKIWKPIKLRGAQFVWDNSNVKDIIVDQLRGVDFCWPLTLYWHSLAVSFHTSHLKGPMRYLKRLSSQKCVLLIVTSLRTCKMMYVQSLAFHFYLQNKESLSVLTLNLSLRKRSRCNFKNFYIKLKIFIKRANR